MSVLRALKKASMLLDAVKIFSGARLFMENSLRPVIILVLKNRTPNKEKIANPRVMAGLEWGVGKGE